MERYGKIWKYMEKYGEMGYPWGCHGVSFSTLFSGKI